MACGAKGVVGMVNRSDGSARVTKSLPTAVLIVRTGGITLRPLVCCWPHSLIVIVRSGCRETLLIRGQVGKQNTQSVVGRAGMIYNRRVCPSYLREEKLIVIIPGLLAADNLPFHEKDLLVMRHCQNVFG